MLQISLPAQEVFHIGSFPVTNALLLSSLVLVLLIVLGFILRKKMAMIPGNFQGIAEYIIEGSLGIMDSLLGDRRISEKYFPLVFTIFIFILCSNWMGLVPGVGSILINVHGESVELLRSPASDLNFTLALALISVTFTNGASVAAIGFGQRLKVFFNFKNPVSFATGLLELVSEFAKIISFSFRLFGNVFAGEVLLAVMAFLVPYVVPLPFMFLEIFVGFMQAFIFAMLTTVFIAMALIVEHGEEEIAHDADHAHPEKVASITL